MSDLFSHSFRQYQDLKRQAHVDDMEVGGGVGNKTIVLDKFFHDVENVKEKLYKKVQESNEESKMVQNARKMKLLRSKMGLEFTNLLTTVKIMKGKLETLDKSIVEHRKIPGYGLGSSVDQTHNSVVTSLSKKLKVMMGDFQELRAQINDEYRETIGRSYFTIIGEKANDELIHNLISTGSSEDFMQKAIQDQGREQIMDTISEIQERHDAFIEIEKNLNELHHIFLDMVVLVEAHGEQLNDVESQVAHISSFIRLGTDQIVEAKKLRKRWRKCACIILVLILIVIAYDAVSNKPTSTSTCIRTSLSSPKISTHKSIDRRRKVQSCKMASTLPARQAANLLRLSSPRSASQAASLIQRRGLAGAADHHGPAKVDFWKDPMSPSRWKEEHFVIISLSGWGLLIFGGYKAFSGGKKKDEKLVEAVN
ncbi:hypothetical protein L1987_06168 [Smallanthus sonchifolius]|uniref:Uncharacterized protein n=1 Tax=Smallanthus sonchifolius TaxID=185202 RepID=A0ACB9JXD3_9ASTR|nr:hypothetical protein L1987_06168 [Smallanthus sonchifolius]